MLHILTLLVAGVRHNFYLECKSSLISGMHCTYSSFTTAWCESLQKKIVIFEAKYSGLFLAKIQLMSLFVADIQILKVGRPEKVTFKFFCRHIFEQHVGGAS